MWKKSALPNQDWALLRLALIRNHLQEYKDCLAAQAQARQSLLDRHRQEMTQITLLTTPLGWALAIHRYTRQLNELHKISKDAKRQLVMRQEMERTELEKWINQYQQVPYDEALFFDQLVHLFNWSLSRQQRQHYHQVMRKGNTLVVTDVTKFILWASQSFFTMTGYQPIEVLGKTPGFLQGHATDPLTIGLIHERLSHGQAVTTELVNYRKNGEAYLCHLKIVPLTNQQEELTHFLAVEYEVKT
jgi:PAS domain S-box-containing protein